MYNYLSFGPSQISPAPEVKYNSVGLIQPCLLIMEMSAASLAPD